MYWPQEAIKLLTRYVAAGVHPDETCEALEYYFLLIYGSFTVGSKVIRNLEMNNLPS